MKLSPGKITEPGAKRSYRGPAGDVLALRGEPAPPGYVPLLIPVMRGGRRLSGPEPLPGAQRRCAADLDHQPGPRTAAIRCRADGARGLMTGTALGPSAL